MYQGNYLEIKSLSTYKLTLSVAELNNGEKVAYAKKILKQDKNLTQKIKKELPTSSTSNNGRSSRMTTTTYNIQQNENDVNNFTKYSIQESENKSILIITHQN